MLILALGELSKLGVNKRYCLENRGEFSNSNICDDIYDLI